MSPIERSESITALVKALAKAQAKIEVVTKNASNPHFRSTYADLNQVIQAVKKPLLDEGITFIQPVFTTEDGKTGVATVLLHDSGEWISSQLILSPVDNKPQTLGSCITYGRRYSLMSILSLGAEDDDGNLATGLKPKPASTVGTTRARTL